MYTGIAFVILMILMSSCSSLSKKDYAQSDRSPDQAADEMFYEFINSEFIKH